MFATRVRYSGASIGAQFSSVAASAPAPMIATALLGAFDSAAPVSLYVIAAALLTVVAVVAARETRMRDLTAVGEDHGAAPDGWDGNAGEDGRGAGTTPAPAVAERE